MSDEAEDSEVRDEGEGGEADVNAERYLEYCRRMGVRPKFSGNWQKANDPRGNFIHDKGFWKLLIDRRMYECRHREGANPSKYCSRKASYRSTPLSIHHVRCIQ